MNILRLMRTVSHSFDSMFSITRTSIVSEYSGFVQSLNLKDSTVLDTGTGNELHYDAEGKNNLIMVDCDARTLHYNNYAGYKIAADISSIPIKSSTVDCCTSCFVMEHLPRPDDTIDEISRVSKRGGIAVILFASKNALFSILARILPEKIKEWLLVLTDNHHKHGFKTYYRYCSLSQMGLLLEEKGFNIKYRSVNYFSAPYYDFLPPMYFLMLTIESLLDITGLSKFASYVFIIAEKN
ncbi:MAG: methyltransferase domain-containing protein [candidate division WOR-3 bacterium]|nr:methyltransferase domain-containing protein [candidate division WOR-3 bacterium]